MDKITIQKTDKCDSRTLKPGEKITPEIVESDTKKHIEAVQKAVKWIGDRANEQAKDHDWTKLGSNLEEFTNALATGEIQNDDCPWYQKHIMTERHHIKSFVHDDVNLIDLIEMVCDCVCAGMARTGTVYPMELPAEVMQKIINNTVELLKANIEVKD